MFPHLEPRAAGNYDDNDDDVYDDDDFIFNISIEYCIVISDVKRDQNAETRTTRSRPHVDRPISE